MAQDIEVKLKLDTSQAVSGLGKVESGLKGATTESKKLSETMQGSKQSEFINQLGDGIGKLNPAFGAAVKGANGLILKMWEMAANPVGAILAGIVVTAKFLYEAFQSSVAGGKELKTIFAGISAVGEQVKDAIFGLGRALINVTTAAYKFITLDFAGAAEDMKKANKETETSLVQLADASDGTTYKIIKNLEKQQQANDKARKMQAVVQSETNKLLVQSREVLTDETASIKDKKKALEEVTKAEKESSAEKVRIAKEDLRIAKETAAQKGGQIEAKSKQELRELTIALNEAETENAMTGIKLNKQKNMLGRQEAADQKAVNDEIKASNKEKHDADKTALDEKLKEEELNFEKRRDLVNNDKLITKEERRKYLEEINKQEKKYIEDKIKEEFDLELAALQRKSDQDLQSLNIIKDAKKANKEALMTEDELAIEAENKRYENKLFNATKSLTDDQEIKDATLELEIEHYDKLNNIWKTSNDKKVATDKAATDATKALAKAEAKAKMDALSSYGDALGSLAGMLGESTDAGKAAAVASATISTYSAANKAYESQLAILTPDAPVRATIAAGIAIASGLLNVQKILSVQTPGGGGGGSAPTASAPAAAMPSFNVVGQSGANQIAESTGKPIKAYVLGSDVTTQQGMNRRIIQNASIG
jgi:hypothetical protein